MTNPIPMPPTSSEPLPSQMAEEETHAERTRLRVEALADNEGLSTQRAAGGETIEPDLAYEQGFQFPGPTGGVHSTIGAPQPPPNWSKRVR